MKKILFMALMSILLVYAAKAQCETGPECQKSFTLSHSYSNVQVTGFNSFAEGVVCFEGDGSIATIPNTFNVAKITTFRFLASDVRYDVKQTIAKANIYVEGGANVTLSKLFMSGGDTIVVAGSLEIKNFTRISGNPIIIMIEDAQLFINGQALTGNTLAGATIIYGCPQALPVRFGKIKATLNPKKN